MLAHDPEKCAAVFLRDKRGTRLRGDHAQNGRRKRDGDFEPSRFTKQSRHNPRRSCRLFGPEGGLVALVWRVIRKSLQRFSEEIMRKQQAKARWRFV
jgi:hypothetical protein